MVAKEAFKSDVTGRNDKEEIDDINLISRDLTDRTRYDETKTNINNGYKVTWRDVKFQIWASNVGYLFFTNDGITLAFSNLLLDEFDSDTASWFASIVGLSIPVGALISGLLMDKFGRKKANVFIAVPCIPAWLATSYVSVNNPFLLYGARILVGIASGLAASNIVYVSEISHKKYRPAFLSLVSFYFAFGILLVSILQTFLTWRQIAFFNGIFFIVVSLLVLFSTPESPVWLANFRDDWDAAKRSLRWLNPNPQVFEEEWNELMESKRSRHNNKKNNFSFNSPTVYKPMVILLALFTLQEASFVYAFIIYAVKIFPLIAPRLGEAIKSEAFALLGVARFLANAVCCLLSLRVGRRPLLLISSVGMAVTCVTLAVAPPLLLPPPNGDGGNFAEWCMIVAFLLFIIFGSFGVMTIPWSLAVELLPYEARSVGSGIVNCYGDVLLFVFAKIFPTVLAIFNACWLFAFVAVVSAFMSAFIFFCVPETLGKSFRQIEKYFQK